MNHAIMYAADRKECQSRARADEHESSANPDPVCAYNRGAVSDMGQKKRKTSMQTSAQTGRSSMAAKQAVGAEVVHA